MSNSGTLIISLTSLITSFLWSFCFFAFGGISIELSKSLNQMGNTISMLLLLTGALFLLRSLLFLHSWGDQVMGRSGAIRHSRSQKKSPEEMLVFPSLDNISEMSDAGGTVQDWAPAIHPSVTKIKKKS